VLCIFQGSHAERPSVALHGTPAFKGSTARNTGCSPHLLRTMYMGQSKRCDCMHSMQTPATAASPADTLVTPALPAAALGASSLVGQAAVVQLLQALGRGYSLLAQYKSTEAIQAFSALPAQQYQTAWVLSKVGKAYFELVNYSQALHFFQWSRNCDPHRVEGLEWHSTVLWHMKREVHEDLYQAVVACVCTFAVLRPLAAEHVQLGVARCHVATCTVAVDRLGHQVHALMQVELSHLAQDALALDRLSPQAWCVMGNCFSLQKEHETAIKFFQRALQIDPTFTYAYTLCGHEYFANEDFDKSLLLHRQATSHDKRHYNAWCAATQFDRVRNDLFAAMCRQNGEVEPCSTRPAHVNAAAALIL
jgi:tetratricopeptide (TPR) repeat protein